MCVSCGCGMPNERHKTGDITMQDLEKAAGNHNLKVEQVVENIQKSARQSSR